MPSLVSDSLAWVVIGAFVAGALLYRRDEKAARYVTSAAWGLFAVFWLQLIPHFAFVHKSYIEGFLSLAAVPACLYAGYLLYSGRETLFVLSRAVAVMGLVYLPFETIPAFTLLGLSVPSPRGVLMETVALQTKFLVNALGYHPEFIASEEEFVNTFLFMDGDHRLTVEVVLACTGLGSMAIFGGLVAAVEAPLRRKFRALAVAIPVIYALNLLRTTFITITFGKQYLQLFVDEVLFLFGSSDPYMVSFFISDRLLSQFLAVVALVGITYVVVREVPELLTVIEDVLYMVTGDEYDLSDALDLESPSGTVRRV